MSFASFLSSALAVLGMVVHACDPATQEAGLGCVVRPHLKQKQSGVGVAGTTYIPSYSRAEVGRLLTWSQELESSLGHRRTLQENQETALHLLCSSCSKLILCTVHRVLLSVFSCYLYD